MSNERPRILIIEARYYDHIADELMAGAVAALKDAGAEWDVVTVPGALEIPGVISIAEKGARSAGGQAYDGYVALGCVIRGETTHYDYVCSETVRAIMDLTVDAQLAIGNGVLTVENEAQALARARVGERNKGGFAARACLEVIAVRGKLLP